MGNTATLPRIQGCYLCISSSPVLGRLQPSHFRSNNSKQSEMQKLTIVQGVTDKLLRTKASFRAEGLGEGSVCSFALIVKASWRLQLPCLLQLREYPPISPMGGCAGSGAAME